jgi:hypothetical protein
MSGWAFRLLNFILRLLRVRDPQFSHLLPAWIILASHAPHQNERPRGASFFSRLVGTYFICGIPPPPWEAHVADHFRFLHEKGGANFRNGQRHDQGRIIKLCGYRPPDVIQNAF